MKSAQNLFLVKDGDNYRSLHNVGTKEEAQAEMSKRGHSGVIVTREEYEESQGRVECVRIEKLEALLEMTNVLSWLQCIEPEYLNDNGRRLIKINREIEKLQSATNEEVEAYDIDASLMP